MRVGVTGAEGLLGSTLVPLWRAAGAEVIPWSFVDCDVVDRAAVSRLVRDARPDVVVHAAAYTAVDRAEAEPYIAMRVNRDGTANVVQACAEVGTVVVYLSTDYVFDSLGASAPIPPGAPAEPVGAYARAKAAGEGVVRESGIPWLIVRTGWVYGPGGQNFVDAMKRAAEDAREVRVVHDQVGAPTSTRLIAEAAWGLVSRGLRGVWHLTAAGADSWYEVARTVYDAVGSPPELLTRITTIELGRAGPRPAYSVLDSSATASELGITIPHWKPQVREFVRTGRMPGLGIVGEA